MKESSARRSEKVIFAPPPMPRYWRLQMRGRIPTVRQKLRAALREAKVCYNESPDGILSVQLADDEAARMTSHLGRWLSSEELEACRARVVAGGTEDLHSVLEGESLRQVLARQLTSWLSDLVDEHRLLVHFQPVVPIASPESLLGHEAFVRGVSRESEVIFPERLFDSAREAGLLEDLDRSARRKSLQRSVSHGLEGLLFMNCHPVAICAADFVEKLSADVADAGLTPEMVVLETGWNFLSTDSGAMENVLRNAREKGFALALDDLGGEPDALRLMKKLAPEYVKVDRALISSIDKDPYRQRLLRDIARLAKPLSIGTIALGVETPMERAWLESERIGYGQGYLFGHPDQEPRSPGQTSIHA